MNAAKDRLRVRELSKYYCVTSSLQLGGSRSRADDKKDDQGNFTPSPPQLAPDATLTALAQLAALRLGTQRSIISIIDDHAQHILAEATKSISPFDLNDHEPGDALILGVQSLPFESCICSIALDAFVDEMTLKLESPGSTANQNSIVIPDLTVEPSTRDRDVIKVMPQALRYYVEVPLRNAAGYVLGSICVIDPVVRQPGPKDVVHLQQVAKLIVEHLEWSRMKEDHRRAERSLEGLAHFIQGKGSISEWSKSISGQKDIPSAYSELAPLSSSQLLDARTTGSTPDVSSPSTEVPGSVRTSSTATKRSNSNLLKSPEGASASNTPPASRRTTSPTVVPSTAGTDIEIGFDPLSGQISNDEVQVSTLTSLGIRQAFSRAANLIRESMDLDATCFLEVPHNERYKNPKKRNNFRQPTNTADPTGQSTSETESMTDSSTDFTPKDTPTDGNSPRDEGIPPPNNVLCHRLGFSTRTRSSLAGSTTSQPYLTIPVSLLTQLTNKYGEGHIFHFDNSGGISSGDDREAQQRPRKKSDRKKVSDRLFRLFPTVRSLIFLPLFDNDRQQVYAGFLGWTTDPTRALQKNEIIYVSGFANSIMYEVMRLQAVATDKAKSDFISSISHELRSPLHGILAAAQLLSESKSSSTREEYAEMIDMCARTLLDIMNHLLDHAKINHFTGSQSRIRPSMRGRRRTESTTYSLVTKMDLLSVVEETCASMAASSNQMLQRDGRRVTGSTLPSDTAYQGVKEALSVPIILNIAPNKVWNFKSEAGSWRRIVMNLIGNSLKYTQQGHISVTLSLRDRTKSDKKCIVELKVTDTGQGISEEYLKHRLYTPFAQENNLSVGAGLGLSLVNQIVSSLKGKIKVNSEVGTGTEISVSIPLETSEESAEERSLAEVYDEELLELAKGCTFEFRGFADWRSIHEPPTGIPGPRTKALLTMSESISGLLREWYELKATSAEADIIVIEEHFLEDNLGEYDHSGNNLLVIGLDGRNNITDKIQHANFRYLLPPVGPKRMAHTLRRLLQARDEMPEESETPLQSADKPRRSDVDRSTLYPLKRSTSLTGNDSRPARRPKMPPTSASSRVVPLRIISPTTSSSATGSSRREAHSATGKESILLVDDNDINLRILVACVTKLKASNIDYITAVDGQQALDAYIEAMNSGTRISIVFMDITMPVMDGLTATRRIRAFEKERGIRRRDRTLVVALTGLASAEAQHEIESCGFDLYLRKPVNLKTVREIMASDREREQARSPDG